MFLVNDFSLQKFHVCVSLLPSQKRFLCSQDFAFQAKLQTRTPVTLHSFSCLGQLAVASTTCVVTAIRHFSLIVAGIGKAIRNKLLAFFTYPFAWQIPIYKVSACSFFYKIAVLKYVSRCMTLRSHLITAESRYDDICARNEIAINC